MKNKIFVFVSILVLGLSAFAQINAPRPAPPAMPPEFQGTFILKADGIKLVQAKHELTVMTLNQEAQDYVASLRAQHYACQNFDARHVKCSRFMKDLQSIGSPFENVYELYKNQKLEIFASEFPVELVNDAEFLTEWKRSQNAQWMGQKFTDLHYTVIKDPMLPEHLVKMKFTNAADQRAYFYVVGHVGGVDIALQHKEVLRMSPAKRFVITETMNCLLEVNLSK